MAKYQGSGVIKDTDFKKVKWEGKNKAGKAVKIELENAINMGDIDWTFKDKDDTVAELVFTATYDNTDEASNSTKEPWTLEVEGADAGAGEILLGAGVLSIGSTAVALSRGGGKFNVKREYREINADGDRGPVKGRINMDGSVATLSINALTILAKVSELYVGIESVTI